MTELYHFVVHFSVTFGDNNRDMLAYVSLIWVYFIYVLLTI